MYPHNKTQLDEDIDYVRVKLGMIDGNSETRRIRLHGRIAQETRGVYYELDDSSCWEPSH